MKFGSCKKITKCFGSGIYSGLDNFTEFDYIETTCNHFYSLKKIPAFEHLHIPTINFSKEKHCEWLYKVCQINRNDIVFHFHKGKMESQNIKAAWIKGFADFLPKVKNNLYLENCDGLTEFWKIEQLLEANYQLEKFDNFGICLDTGHAYKLGGNSWIQEIMATQNVKRLHCHDAYGHKAIGLNNSIDHLPIGKGNINFENIDISNIDCATLEIFGTEKEIIKSKSRLKSIWNI